MPVLCLPTIIFLIISLASVLASTARGAMLSVTAGQVITLGAMAAVMELLCRAGYARVAWGLLAFLVFAPLVVMFPLLALLLLVLWLVYRR